ncbi:MAG: T9SS type A sorting domain-containing protein [Bacteroidota bacterium]
MKLALIHPAFSKMKQLLNSYILTILLLSGLFIQSNNLQAFVPIVDLGADTISCASSLILDAGNAGATFLWSTGEVSQSITVSNSGKYWVEVSDGTGTSSDTIEVQIISTPSPPSLSDTTICQGESISFSLPLVSDGVIWYDSPSGGNIIGSGNNFSLSPQATQTIYAANFNRGIIRAGLPDTAFGTVFYGAASSWGEVCEAIEPVSLEAVHVYADAPLTFDLEIKNSAGEVIFLQNYSVNIPFEKTRIPVGLDLPAAAGYEVRARNISGGGLAVIFPATVDHPLTVPDVFSITQGVIAIPRNRHFYFFDWEIGRVACTSSRVPTTITVSPTPSVDLGKDTILCSGNTSAFTLDATNTGASYLWNDGSQNPTFTVQSTDTVSVLVAIGQCTTTDEIAVYIFDEPAAPAPLDTSICGIQEINLSNIRNGSEELSFWYDAQGDFLFEGDSFAEFVSDSTQLLLQNVNTPTFSLGRDFTRFPTSFLTSDVRGIQLNALQDILIQSLAVYPVSSQAFSMEIVAKDSMGIEVYRKSFSLSPPYAKEVLEVDIFLPKGNRYIIELATSNGNSLWRDDVDPSVFPYVQENLAEIIAGTKDGLSGTTQYNYFYDLEIAAFGNACKSAQVPYDINVILPFDLPDSVYSCTETVLDPDVVASSYTWSTNETSPSILVTETGMYTLSVSDGANCQITDSVFVEIPLDAGLEEDGILCGNTLATVYGPDAQYLWSTGETSSTIQVSDPGTYSVQLTEPRGCVLTDTIVITGFDSFPVVDLGIDQSACESLELDAGNPGLNFLWSTGENSQQITVSSSGLYSVIVSNTNNCQAVDTIGIAITPNPVAMFSVADTVIGGVSRRVNFVNQSSFGSYLWRFGDGNSSSAFNPSYTYADTGTYCVDLIVADLQNNCGSDTLTKCIVVLQYPLSISNEEFPTSVILAPNPAENILSLEFESSLAGDTQLDLFNLSGQLIQSKDLKISRSGQIEQLDVSHIPRGIYLLRLRNGSLIYRQKIILQ